MVTDELISCLVKAFRQSLSQVGSFSYGKHRSSFDQLLSAKKGDEELHSVKRNMQPYQAHCTRRCMVVFQLQANYQFKTLMTRGREAH